MSTHQRPTRAGQNMSHAAPRGSVGMLSGQKRTSRQNRPNKGGSNIDVEVIVHGLGRHRVCPGPPCGGGVQGLRVRAAAPGKRVGHGEALEWVLKAAKPRPRTPQGKGDGAGAGDGDGERRASQHTNGQSQPPTPQWMARTIGSCATTVDDDDRREMKGGGERRGGRGAGAMRQC